MRSKGLKKSFSRKLNRRKSNRRKSNRRKSFSRKLNRRKSNRLKSNRRKSIRQKSNYRKKNNKIKNSNKKIHGGAENKETFEQRLRRDELDTVVGRGSWVSMTPIPTGQLSQDARNYSNQKSGEGQFQVREIETPDVIHGMIAHEGADPKSPTPPRPTIIPLSEIKKKKDHNV